MHNKSIDWFLYNCNIRLIWVKIDKILINIARIGLIKPSLYLMKSREKIWFPRLNRMKAVARNRLKELSKNLQNIMDMSYKQKNVFSSL